MNPLKKIIIERISKEGDISFETFMDIKNVKNEGATHLKDVCQAKKVKEINPQLLGIADEFYEE